MTEVTFHTLGEIPDEDLRYAVICSRYQGKWIFCRHRNRSTWEIPGGHREKGESMDEAARRELWEETGTVNGELLPVCIYGVSKNLKTSYGMLYFAEVQKLESLPRESEIKEISLASQLPEDLTYPDIQPHLFQKVQGWLNLRSHPGELWDVYDRNRALTGKVHRRGDDFHPGEYHLVVHVWIQNGDGRFLMTQRSPNKGFPLLWETTGGSALAGENSLTAALREAREETGLELNPHAGRIIHQYSRRDDHTDVWLFRQEFSLDQVILQEGETSGARIVTGNEIIMEMKEGNIVPYTYLQKWMDQGFLLTVEQGEEQDMPAVAALACRLWPDHPLEEMIEEFMLLAEKTDAAVFLAYADGNPIGFAQCQLRYDYVEGTSSSPVGYLEGIFVKEEYRRKGIAKALLKACEGWAEDMGSKEFASDCELTNYESLRFHLALGFVEANRIICFTKEIGGK